MAEVLTGTEREQTAEPSRRAWPGWLRRWAVERLDLDKLGIDFVLPGGTRLASANGRPLATVRVLHALDLFRMLWDPEDTFAEGYTTGRVEVEGDLEELLERIYTVSRNRRSPEWYTAQGLLEGTRDRARASRTSSSSKTTTVPSRGTATRSCRWGCSNTSARATTRLSAR